MSHSQKSWLMPVLAFLCGTLLALWWQRDIGVVRDEVVYMDAGDKYAVWWSDVFAGKRNLSEQSIAKGWGGPSPTDNNREHPPLHKVLIGASHAIALKTGLTNDKSPSLLAAYRFPTALLFGALLALVFVWVRSTEGSVAALLSVLFVASQPRILYQASLACFDLPVVFWWMATLYAFHKCMIRTVGGVEENAEERPRRTAYVWLALALGGALATKHNALFLPFIFLLFATIAGVMKSRGHTNPMRWFANFAGRTWPIVLACAGGVVVFIALWPWLWFHPVQHIGEWVSFHLTHVHYNYEYLGLNRNTPPFPWHVPLVTTLVTMPFPIFIAGCIGVANRKQWTHSLSSHLLWMCAALVAIAPFFFGGTPIFGAEKHWLFVYVVWAMFAGIGVARMLASTRAKLASQGRLRLFQPVALAILLFIGSALTSELVHGRTYGLSHYNGVFGGASGGADLGMNRQFWGGAARGILPQLSMEASYQPIRKLYTHDASPAFAMYRKSRLVPEAVREAGGEYQHGIAASDAALVVLEKHFLRHDLLIWMDYGSMVPQYVLTVEGVPLVSLYARSKVAPSGGIAAPETSQ